MSTPGELPSWLREAFDELHRTTADLDAAARAGDHEGIVLLLERRAACIALLEPCVGRYRAEAGALAEPLLALEGARVAEAAARVQRGLEALQHAAGSALEEMLGHGAAARGYTASAVSTGAFERTS